MKARIAAIAALALFATAAMAQTITDGNATFTFATSTTKGSADFRPEGGTTTDHLFQNWWWTRVNGVDTRENSLPWSTAGGNGVIGPANTLTKTFTGLEGERMSGALQIVLTDSATAGAATIVERLGLINTSSTPLSLSVFNYADFDVGGTSASDNATLTGPSEIRMRITDGSNFAEFLGVGASAFSVRTWGAANAWRTVLEDTAINDADNLGLPFVNGDFTGVYQWNFTLEPGGTAVLTEGLAVNTAAVPEPATLLLLALGALARRR